MPSEEEVGHADSRTSGHRVLPGVINQYRFWRLPLQDMTDTWLPILPSQRTKTVSAVGGGEVKHSAA